MTELVTASSVREGSVHRLRFSSKARLACEAPPDQALQADPCGQDWVVELQIPRDLAPGTYALADLDASVDSYVGLGCNARGDRLGLGGLIHARAEGVLLLLANDTDCVVGALSDLRPLVASRSVPKNLANGSFYARNCQRQL